MSPAGDPVAGPAGDPVAGPAGDPVAGPAGDPVAGPAGDPAAGPAGDPAAGRSRLPGGTTRPAVERPAAIHQVVPSFAGRDAIGTHTLLLRDLFRSLGLASDIYAGGSLPEVSHLARSLDDLPARTMERTWLLFHHSSGSPVADRVLARREPLLVDYHNITPAALIDRWAPWVRDEVEQGRHQLAELAGRAVYAFADSGYNEAELLDVGFRHTAVAAPLFDPSAAGTGDDPAVAAELRERRQAGAVWLFVGRVSPHKAQHDVVKAFACYREWFDPGATLVLAGTGMGTEYPGALDRFVRRLGIDDAVTITGLVSDAALASYYRGADVFVCASDHEGFCVPLVEAMHHGLPVVAYGATAVPETVGAGGLVLADKAPAVVAAAVHRVLGDPVLRQRLVAAGRRRAADFSPAAGRVRWAAAIEESIATVTAATAGPDVAASGPDVAAGGAPGARPPGRGPGASTGTGGDDDRRGRTSATALDAR